MTESCVPLRVEPARRRRFIQPDSAVRWAAGRKSYAVWLVFVTEPLVLERLAGFAADLKPLLVPGYVRQPHITLAAAGFPTAQARTVEDYTEHAFHQHLAALAGLALPAFEVEVGGADSFEMSPYLEVRDATGGLAALQSTLCGWTQAGNPFDYVPHITAGFYREGADEAEIQRVLAKHREKPTLRCVVDSVALAVYDPRALGGPLVVAHQVALPAQGFARSSMERFAPSLGASDTCGPGQAPRIERQLALGCWRG